MECFNPYAVSVRISCKYCTRHWQQLIFFPFKDQIKFHPQLGNVTLVLQDVTQHPHFHHHTVA